MASTNLKESTKDGEKKPIRVWVDGCFDMMHYGHANALRQAKEMGDYLVVGVHSDAEIAKHKGIPVMCEEERYMAVEACKWVDEVVRDAPYTTQLSMLEQYKCDFCVHGDDISTTADGTDSYKEVKKAGRYRECKRTPSVSTTELVGRMLLMTRDHHARESDEASESKRQRVDVFSSGKDAKSPYTSISHILPTTQRIVQFSNAREPKPTDKVIYVDGAFDLFHVGHIELLRRAKEMGDFVLVGIHDDQTVNRVKGANYPIMNLHERLLSVLACKYVDEIIIGAPYSVTAELIKGPFKIHLVVHGNSETVLDLDGGDPYKVPKELGCYRQIETKYSDLTAQVIVDRIIMRRQIYEERNRKKQAKELAILASAASSTVNGHIPSH